MRPAPSEHVGAAALALLLGLVTQLPHLAAHRVFVNLDHNLHYAYAREYAAAMAGGDPWPRWAFAAQHGLGEPGPLYYSPLYYVASALLARLTGSVWTAMQLVEIGCAGALGYFAWRLPRAYAGRGAAAAAIPLAVLSPMLCLLQLGFNGYPWGCAVAPVAAMLCALLRPGAEYRLVNLPAAIALALAIAIHTVSGLLGILALGALSLGAIVSTRTLAHRRVWAPAIVAIFGLLLSAFYLLPAYGSQGLINAAVWRTAYVPFNAFALPTVTAALFGMRWFAFQWPLPLIALTLAGLSLAGWRAQAEERAAFAGMAAIVLLVLVLGTELSYPLWLPDTPLRNVQFPFRLVTLLVPIGATLAAIALDRARGALRVAVAAVALASVALGGAIVAKALVHDGRVIDVSEGPLAPYTGLDEYRTAAAMRAPAAARPYDFAAACSRAQVRCSAGRHTGRGMDWAMTARLPTRLLLPVRCFPSWRVAVDGRDDTDCDPATTLLAVRVPAGDSVVTLRWRMLPKEQAGLWLSLIALAALLAGAMAERRVSRRRA